MTKKWDYHNIRIFDIRYFILRINSDNKIMLLDNTPKKQLTFLNWNFEHNFLKCSGKNALLFDHPSYGNIPNVINHGDIRNIYCMVTKQYILQEDVVMTHTLSGAINLAIHTQSHIASVTSHNSHKLSQMINKHYTYVLHLLVVPNEALLIVFHSKSIECLIIQTVW